MPGLGGQCLAAECQWLHVRSDSKFIDEAFDKEAIPRVTHAAPVTCRHMQVDGGVANSQILDRIDRRVDGSYHCFITLCITATGGRCASFVTGNDRLGDEFVVEQTEVAVGIQCAADATAGSRAEGIVTNILLA